MRTDSSLDLRIRRLETAYDEIPYHRLAATASHPDRLAPLATLSGLQPPPVDRWRILELACGRGGNLIPMAASLPDAEFVGIDLSRQQLQDAEKLRSRLDLENVRLEHADILDLGAELGRFDLILALGVFSWVPEEVQEKVLSICDQLLTDQGLCCLNHAVYPGSQPAETVRDFLLYHLEPLSEPAERLEAARGITRFLAESLAGSSHPYATSFSHLAVKALESERDFYHEHISTETRPLHFHRFAEMARGHGLRFLGDAQTPLDDHGGLPPETVDQLNAIADPIRRESYLDFVLFRSARQSVLCRSDRSLDRAAPPSAVEPFFAAAPLVAEAVDLSAEVDVSFRVPNGSAVTPRSPVTKAAFALLGEQWPRGIRFETLFEAASARVSEAGTPTAEVDSARHGLATDVNRCYRSGLVELRARQVRCVTRTSSRPTASLLSRRQVEIGGSWVTSQRHENVALDTFSRNLLLLLDGEHPADELHRHFVELAEGGEMIVRERGEPVSGSNLDRQIAQLLASTLQKLAANALLVG